MSSILDRPSAEDRFRERRIAVLRDRCDLAFLQGDGPGARKLWEELKAEINARSPAQVARLEAQKGLG